MTTRSLHTRHAFTLIELLVVIAILLMITAAAIPIMVPAMSGRKTREAARITSSFFGAARARAIENGRPVGVLVERYRFPNSTPTSSDPRYSLVLSMIEVPEPWAGDYLNSQISITPKGCLAGFVTNDSGWMQAKIRPGDQVKVDYRGRVYTLFAGEAFNDLDGNNTYSNGEPYVDADGDGSYTPAASGLLDSDGNFALPPNLTSDPKQLWTLGCLDPGAPLQPALGPQSLGTTARGFQIIRQPTRSSSPPVQLPDDLIIDLEMSGAYGIPSWTSAFTDQPAVIFAPNGSVSWVYDGSTPKRPLGPIFFLIGRRDLMRDVTPNGQDLNLGNDPQQANVGLKNLWVGIGHQTGLITTTEMGSDFDGDGSITIFESRAYAQQAQGMGGR